MKKLSKITVRLGFSIPLEERQDLELAADVKGMSLSEFMRYAVNKVSNEVINE